MRNRASYRRAEPTTSYVHLINWSVDQEQYSGRLKWSWGACKSCSVHQCTLSGHQCKLSEVSFTIQAQEFIQETGRSAREHYLRGHLILLLFPGISDTMKAFIAGEKKMQTRSFARIAFNSSSSMSHRHRCCSICDSDITFSFKDMLLWHIVKG